MTKKGKTVAFIPARCGSKSIPFKNIRDFCGRPLIYWCMEALERSSLVDEIVLATDCEDIANIAIDFGFNKMVIYHRDKENASDTSSTESVMLEYLGKEILDEQDTFILVQATCPFITAEHIDEALQLYTDPNVDSVLTCVRKKEFIWASNNTPINYDFKARPRRQDFDGIYVENGAFYINSVRNILTHKNRLSGKIVIYEMPEYAGIDIDEELDWQLAEKVMNKNILSSTKKKDAIKLFLTDVDGVLTDAGMYYSEDGNELKKFNTHDGMGFELLRNKGIKTGIITSENTRIVAKRADKLKVDFLHQGAKNKLEIAENICAQHNIRMSEVAFIGDDINDEVLLSKVGLAACPQDATESIKKIPGIRILSKNGGEGVVREFIETILK